MRRCMAKKYQRQFSIITLVLFFMTLVPFPVHAVESTETNNISIVSPEVNEDGTVTFRANYEGDTLYLVGSMNDWDNAGREMQKNSDGVFEVTIELNPGTYEYKFFPVSGNWEGGFTDPNNINTNNGNSVLVIEDTSTVISPEVGKDGTVTFRAKYEGETLYLVGSMNGWNEKTAIEMTKNDAGVFEVTTTLEPGAYEYKYIPTLGSWDGDFKDPHNPNEANGNSFVLVKGESNLVSPEVNENGTVTFRANYNGDSLYLIGSMVGWDTSKQIPMTKDENGVFSVTLSLDGGKYEYKFKPNKDNWENSFVDSANDLVSDGNSLAIVPGLSLTIGDSVQAGTTMELTADLYDAEGNKTTANPTWSLVEPVTGVAIEENTLTVAKDADDSRKIKVKATEGAYIAEGEISIISNMYTYIINYYRPVGDYSDWDLWLWEPNKNGAGHSFNVTEGVEAGFVRAEYKFASDKLGFIVRKSDWSDKDGDKDRFIEVKEGNTVEVWLVQGDDTIYYNRDAVDTTAKLKSAIMDSTTEVVVSSTAKIEDSELDTFKLKDVTNDKELKVKATRIDDTKVSLTVEKQLFKSTEIDVRNLYEVSSNSFSPKTVIMRKILDDSKYYYKGNDLGLTYASNESTFKVWAPTATKVSLALYDNEGAYNEQGKVTDHTGGREIEMDRADNGVWSVSVKEDLNNKYYMYKVEFADGTTNYAVDPYAKAVSGNGQRTAVVDFSNTNPANWGSVVKPELLEMNDSIIYEMHVRDFSISDDSGMTNKGKFEALTEEGTKIEGTEISTGVDHLKDLGITHVHLLPSYDYASVNEMSDEAQFNWGYDPQNYNVPEGSYATSVENPEARVREFKEMVQSLHKNGIRVVMDVVYNHTYNIGENSPFDPVVPGYFYRTDDTGKYTNGSGCGNEVATERPMVRKYIKDSVKYWAEEYDVDGFRFDLMGLIDTKTMTELTNEVKAEIDPSIIIYGEPWQAGGSILPSSQQTVKGSQKDQDFAVFNDNFRGAIKGDSDGAGQGFATGATGKENDIVTGVKGAITDFTNGPNETINYVTAHDNLNLWDKIIKAAGKDKESGFLQMQDGSLTGEDAENYGSVAEAVEKKAKPYAVITEENPLDNEYVKRSILTTAITMTSQGVPFFQAGDEFLRSKYGDHNSYKSPDAINQINWENKKEFSEVYDYYKGLIELRKSHPAFRMNTKAAIESNLVVLKSDDNVVVFQLKDFANGDGWKNIVVAYNGNTTEKEFTLPSTSEWNVVVNDEQAGTEVIETLSNTNKATVAPLSAMVLYDESIEGEEQVPTTIEANISKVGINPGDYKFVKAVVRDQNGRVITSAPIEWTVSDESIIKVDAASGKITALKEGEATITLTCGEAKTDIEVSVAKLVPTEITIQGADNVFTTREIELSTVVKDQFGQLMNNPEIEWTSSNETVATVSGLGVVKGINPGKVVITAKAGNATATKNIEVNKYTKKYIEFTYEREDQDYDGWNIWTWQTGVQDGQQDFTKVENGKAIVKFEIAPDTTAVGFVLRKGTGWDEKDPYDSDRYIKIDPAMTVTKVTIKSGEGEFFQVPAVKEAEINKGALTFQYRDEDLYAESAQDTIDKVEVKVIEPGLIFKSTKTYEMSYDNLNEYFEYTLNDIKSGIYEYSFLVTKGGETTEIPGDSIEYKQLTIGGSTTVSPTEINYDENAVVTLELTGEDAAKDSIREIYMDLTSVGGANKVAMDLDLLENNKIAQTIAVKDSVTTGDKTVPVIIVDKNGEEHKTNATITIKSKVSVGDLDFGFDESRIYFTVTDRFFNGNTSNDDPNGIGYDKTNPYTYHGGDLKGLTERVPYLSDLGINTIWISPIVENTDFNQQFSQDGSQYSYHGYWAKDFEKLDPHFGTMEELHELIDTAHDNGIKIMVDVVLNHAGYGMNKVEGNVGADNYPTDDDRAIFEGMFRTNPGSDFITQELSGMPDFKTEDPTVRAKLIEWQTGWIERSKTDKGNTIDYFRVDTVKHVENATWKAFKNRLTELDPDFKLIGEYYGADINATGDQLNNGQMDALLDFQYKEKAIDIVNGKINDASKYLDDRASKIDNTTLMGQFLSSHDEDGFLTRVDGDLGKQMVGASLQITDKGIPVVYYGEELGMSGKNGMDNSDANRYDMDWDRLNDSQYSTIYNHYKKLLNIRDDYSLVFAKGDRQTISGGDTDKYTVFSRSYNGESITTVLNVDEESKSVTVSAQFEPNKTIIDVYSGIEYTADSNGTVQVTVPAMKDGGTVILATKEDDVPNPEENKAPVINASDVTLTVGDSFNAKDGVTAQDEEDGDLTSKIEVVSNNVDTTKAGEYKVVYSVTDSQGKISTKEIKVTVKDKEVVPPVDPIPPVDPTPPGEVVPPAEETIKVTGVKLNKTSLKLNSGKTYQLKATIEPKDATNKDVTWSSSNDKVVTVDKDGNVKAISQGKAIITVTTKDGGFTAQCEVTVNKSGITGLPSTGGNSPMAIMVIGALLVGTGVVIVLKKKKEVQR